MVPRAHPSPSPALCALRSRPRWFAGLCGQVEQGLGLLALVVGQVRLAAEGLLPLGRMCLQALTVDALAGLHVRAIGGARGMGGNH